MSLSWVCVDWSLTYITKQACKHNRKQDKTRSRPRVNSKAPMTVDTVLPITSRTIPTITKTEARARITTTALEGISHWWKFLYIRVPSMSPTSVITRSQIKSMKNHKDVLTMLHPQWRIKKRSLGKTSRNYYNDSGVYSSDNYKEKY